MNFDYAVNRDPYYLCGRNDFNARENDLDENLKLLIEEEKDEDSAFATLLSISIRNIIQI